VMNSYQSMSVPASASAQFAQFYQHATAAASAVSAASAGAIGVDSLGNACTQPASGVMPGAGGAGGAGIADLPRYPWMTLTGESTIAETISGGIVYISNEGEKTASKKRITKSVLVVRKINNQSISKEIYRREENPI